MFLWSYLVSLKLFLKGEKKENDLENNCDKLINRRIGKEKFALFLYGMVKIIYFFILKIISLFYWYCGACWFGRGY